VARLEIKEVKKYYKQGKETVKALDGVSFEVEAGEFMAIVGKSGSGKTTLLDIMGLLLHPSAGEVIIDGKRSDNEKDANRSLIRSEKIGFIFQEYNLIPTLNVLENVMLPARYAKNRRNAKKRALELIEQVGLKDRIKHRPAELSGGQQQRVAIARSMVNDPTIILADEPTGNLDSQTGEAIVKLLSSLAENNNTTVIVVTHDQELAMQTNRVIQIQDGTILRIVSPNK
jgi:putative ABC transport system ATP-binding protein